MVYGRGYELESKVVQSVIIRRAGSDSYDFFVIVIIFLRN